MSLGHRFVEALARTRQRLLRALQEVMPRSVEAGLRLEALEEALLQADVGVEMTGKLIESLRTRLRAGADEPSLLWRELRQAMVSLFPPTPPEQFPTVPTVVLVVGVNGFGKTTTVAKLAYRWKQQGRSVLVAAADTYRAAAIEQLQRWAERLDIPCIRQQYGADPAAVAYDALQAAQARGIEVVLIDTAGRLHTKAPLMAELEKLVRVLRKLEPTAPQETFLVLDASIGQNAVLQAREFLQRLPLTGIVLTKVDGSARGGMALAVAHTCGVPVRYLGIGEGVEDLVPFEPEAFVDALLQGLEAAVLRE